MNKTLILMQGIPGSGKSTMASNIAMSRVLSTDDFWYTVAGDDQFSYDFDISRIGEAHRWNQQRCVESMQEGIAPLIIDNTNIKRRDAEVYFALAKVYGYEVQVVSVQVPVEVAIARQADRPVDRRIPEDVIRRMHENMEKLV